MTGAQYGDKGKRGELGGMLLDSYRMLEVPDVNYGLYARYQPMPDTRTRWRRLRDEVVYRLTGALDCLMGRGK